MTRWIPRLLPFLLISENLWARAGGGGGGHSFGGGGHGGSSFGGGGGGGGDGGVLFQLLFWLLFQTGPVGWVIILVVIVLVVRYVKSARTSYYDESSLSPEAPPASIPADFFQGESLPDFQNKVSTAFLVIQQSWSEKRLDLMRRFITDGVYQRFNAQFTMMNLLEQKNPISDIRVHGLQIVKVSQEGGYDCVDVAISASATDQFICGKFPHLNSPGGYEPFTEYWSFIRRHDYQRGADIFHSEQCPKCSAPLTSKLVETARCPYCGTYLNSGEYDWVLSEITQEGDYGAIFSGIAPPDFAEVMGAYPEFSTHMVEDRASNAFMQILIGSATQNINVLKRFSTAEAFETYKKFLPQQTVAYNRLYPQAVEVVRADVQGPQIRCYVAIKYAYQRIGLNDNPSSVFASENLHTDTKILVMMRIVSDAVAKGSVYANSCPACGAAQKDSLAAVCSYCGSSLNDPKLDWVVEELTDLEVLNSRQ